MSLLLSTKAVTIFLIVTFLLCGIATLLIRPTTFPKSRTNVFISILASVMVVFIGLSLLFSSITLEEQEETSHIAITKEAIDRLWLYPNRLLANSRQASANFLKSLCSNNSSLYNLPTPPETASVHSILEEQNIATVMIQAWEDYLTMHHLDETGAIVWLNNFIQWAQSPYLEKYFELLKYNFKATTIDFGYLLFEYAKKLPLPTTNPEMYHSTVTQLRNDPRMIKLLQPLQ